MTYKCSALTHIRAAYQRVVPTAIPDTCPEPKAQNVTLSPGTTMQTLSGSTSKLHVAQFADPVWLNQQTLIWLSSQ